MVQNGKSVGFVHMSEGLCHLLFLVLLHISTHLQYCINVGVWSEL